MRKALFSMLSLAFVATLFADNYKILQMNTSSVKIGNRECKKGDVFSDDSVIVWTKEKQAIKAQNLQTKEIHLFTEIVFKKQNVKTIKEYFIKTNRMSSRIWGFSELSEQLNDTFFLLDTIRIESPIPLDSTRNYLIQYYYANTERTKILQNEDDHFIICRNLFEICDSINEYKVRVLYRARNVREDYLITDSMHIIILPLSIEE